MNEAFSAGQEDRPSPLSSDPSPLSRPIGGRGRGACSRAGGEGIARFHVAYLALLTLLALALWWPLPARITTHVPGTPTWAFDESTFLWNTWYFRHALLDLHTNPLHSDLIWHPLGIDLILYTYNFFNAMAALPLYLATGNLPLASNLTLILQTVLSAYGAFLLTLYVTNGESANGASANGETTDDTDATDDTDMAPGESARSVKSVKSVVGESANQRTSEWANGRRGEQRPGGSATQQPEIRNPKSEIRNLLTASLAGLVYAFASNRAIYAALGHYDMVSTGFIPFYALYLLKTLDTAGSRRAYRHALLAGLTFTLAVLAEMIFAVFLGFLTLVLLLTHRLRIPNTQYPIPNTQYPISNIQYPIPNTQSKIRNPVIANRHLLTAIRYFSPLTLMALVAALLWSPVLVPVIREFLTGDYALKGWGESIKLSTDLLGFITPTALHPVWGTNWARELRAVEEGTARFADVNTVFLGYVTLALALLGALVGRTHLRNWVWTAILFALFCLGPFLQVNGRWQFDLDGVPATFPMPFALLHYLPFVKGNRAPNRNSVVLMLALAVLAGHGALWLTVQAQRLVRPVERLVTGARRATLALPALLAFAVLFEHAATPLPLSDARVPEVYDLIAAQPRDFALLQVPLGWRNSFGVFGVERTRLQYYQTRHGRPMLGGNISRAPDFKMAYFRRVPLFRAVAEVEFGREPDPDLVAQARAQAPELMRLYNVRYVLLFPPIPGRYPYVDTWQRTWRFVRDVLPLAPQPFWAGDGIEAYQVLQPDPPVATRADLGEPGTAPYRGEGWYDDEVIQGRSAVWAGADGTEARLFLRADSSGPHTLTLSVLPFTYEGAPPQTLQVLLNGYPLNEPQVLAPGWQEVILSVPPGVTRDHTNVITLRFAWSARPRDVFPGRKAIGRTGVEVPVDVELTAFAGGAYMSTVDDEGNRQDVSFGRRGYNVTVLDPETGRVLGKAGFDTYANVYEAARLAEFIAQIPAGAIVLVATRDDAGRHLTDEAVAALRTLGSAVDLRDYPGQFHALAGVKGAEPGTAAEVVHPESAYIRLGDYPDFRHLAMAVDRVALIPAR